MKKISVLMSTYNGEDYIKAQLDSLVKQNIDGFELNIIIRDDGSSDSTNSILQNYEKHYPDKIKVYYENNIGWADSFIRLLFMCDKSDYYAFCDQDDIWNENKLSSAIKKLEKFNEAALYCSSAEMVDNNMNNVGIFDIPCEFDIQNTIIKCRVLGCTQVFNHKLYEKLIKISPGRSIPHDWWTMCVALLDGRVIADQNSYILYRQTGHNVFGGKSSLSKKLLKIIRDNSHKREILARTLLESGFKCEFIELVANYRFDSRTYFKLIFCRLPNVSLKKRVFFRLYSLVRKV